MRVILKQDIPTLGRAGDIKEVKDGYARNFLFPRGLVMNATVRSVKEKAFLEQVQARKIAKRKKSAEELAAQLNGKEVTLQAKVGEDNKLFGSITNIQISKQLEAMGFQVDRRSIALDDNIKALGNYKVQIKLHDGVNATIQLHVVAG
ncbi:50S ribosomal protein L9 [Turneriella parva]|uniref:Large ribosomal subunit protein bL9 n=1 Tax=Turneriella parva (strain ATCC BAA-1111 / DSM 21527 / NCTC 11395 / H) TaxID=869212 RepID=I4B8K5_TURPD|nr:50S ribosomal protein L9 [Turneriella parva]AFM13612.1 LSU ribosomal protein L9P [Turneriella parva DSM 21527]